MHSVKSRILLRRAPVETCRWEWLARSHPPVRQMSIRTPLWLMSFARPVAPLPAAGTLPVGEKTTNRPGKRHARTAVFRIPLNALWQREGPGHDITRAGFDPVVAGTCREVHAESLIARHCFHAGKLKLVRQHSAPLERPGTGRASCREWAPRWTAGSCLQTGQQRAQSVKTRVPHLASELVLIIWNLRRGRAQFRI